MSEAATGDEQGQSLRARFVIVGDTFDLPNGHSIQVVGRTEATETPGDAQELYQVKIHGDGETHECLYGPHHFANALEAGAVYRGTEGVDDRRDPFWCDGCKQPYLSVARRDDPILDGVTCSYGCSRQVAQDSLAALNAAAGVSAETEFDLRSSAESVAFLAERREDVTAGVVGHLDGGQRAEP